MKTLPEILKPVYAGSYDDDSVTEAQEAIAKELMGCLPEYRDNTDSPIPLPEYDDLISVEVNKTLDEVRARLTAFIGHKEK